MKLDDLYRPILFQNGGHMVTWRDTKQHGYHPYVEDISDGGWYLPVPNDYASEVNIEIMKLVKKYYDTSNGILHMPYCFARKDIPELHEIAGEPDELTKEWFYQYGNVYMGK